MKLHIYRTRLLKALTLLIFSIFFETQLTAQINIDYYLFEGRNKIYFADYDGAIDNFNSVIRYRPKTAKAYFYRGIAKQYLEDYYGAQKDLDRAIYYKPYFPDAFMYRGMINHTLKNYEIALDDYTRSIDLEINNHAIFNNRGITYAALELFDEAIKDYNKALKINPTATNTLLNRAIIHQMRGNFDSSIEDCTKAIKLRPFQAQAYIMRAQSYLEQKDYAGTLKDIDKALELDNKLEGAYYLRGLAKHRLDDLQGALSDYSQAIELNPQMAGAYYNRGIVKERLNMEAANDFREAARLDKDIAKLQQQLSEEAAKQRDPWYYALSQKYKNKNKNSSKSQGAANNNTEEELSNSSNPTPSPQFTDSMKIVERIKAIEGLSYKDKLAKGEARRENERNGAVNILVVEDNGEVTLGAKSDLEERTDGLIQNTNIDIDLAPIFSVKPVDKKSGGFEQIKHYSAEVEEINQKNGDIPLLTINNIPDAPTLNFKREAMANITRFSQLISNDINPTSSKYSKATLHLYLKDYVRALNEFNKLLKENPNNTLSLLGRSICHAAMGDYIVSTKRSEADIVLESDTKQSDTPINLDEYNRAIADLTKIVDRDPDFIFARYNRANIYIKVGKYKEAERDYTECIKTNPRFAQAHFNRALTNIFLGNVEQGANDLSKAGELGYSSAYNVLKRYGIY